MELAEHIVLLFHFLGWGAVVGGLAVQMREPEKRVNSAMRDGIGLAVLAGLVLVGIIESGDEVVDHAKVGVKFVVGLVILVLTLANMRKERIPNGLFWGLVALTIGNIGVAIFW